MRILGSVVLILLLAMCDTRHHFGFGCIVTLELIRNDQTRNIPQPFQKLAKEFLGRSLISVTLDQDIPTRLHPDPLHARGSERDG
jgi:hypothetical protein